MILRIVNGWEEIFRYNFYLKKDSTLILILEKGNLLKRIKEKVLFGDKRINLQVMNVQYFLKILKLFWICWFYINNLMVWGFGYLFKVVLRL